MDVSNTMRIVILGKTGTGKSSLANTIFGEERFTISYSLNSETNECNAETKSVNGRSITLIDTPGFFDTGRSEEELKPEIVRCITECAPGPHAFLIVLKVERFTEHEKSVINKIHEYFSEEVFKYATVLFTHGDQLPEDETIKDFVHQNKLVSDLVKKCGNRCHVIDNKYWNKEPKHEYRSNQFQVEELLKSIDKTLLANKGSYYTNDMLEAVEKEIQQEKNNMKQSSGHMSEKKIREMAKVSVFKKLLIRLAGFGTGVLLGAFGGVAAMVGLVVVKISDTFSQSVIDHGIANIAVAGQLAAAAVEGAAATATATTVACAAVGVAAGVGAVKGGVAGYHAAEGADTPKEAAKRTAEALLNGALSVIKTNEQRQSQSKLKHN